MSREAWGDPPDPEPQYCPVCGGQWHADGCELGDEVGRRLRAEAEAARLREALDAETTRWEAALRLTWKMVDPLKPAGQPGSYWRAYDAGITCALTTLRANLKPPNVLLTGDQQREQTYE